MRGSSVEDGDMNRFLTPQLDRELIAGADPQRDPALERRGEKLCARPMRAKLAAAIEAVVGQAGDGDQGISSSAPVRAADVLAARTQLTGLARRLRSDTPVDPQGVLLARRLLSDPASALNAASGTASLRAAIRNVNAALDPR
jgi:hypothetical protein